MIELLTISWQDFLNPEFYINNGGLWVFLFIVFAETGLLIGFFLPGDSLLFVAGIYSTELANYLFNSGSDFLDLIMVAVMVIMAFWHFLTSAQLSAAGSFWQKCFTLRIRISRVN